MATHSYIGRRPRNFIHKHINYLHVPLSGGRDNTVYQGITIDESDEGMCLYIYHSASEGDSMTVSYDMYSSPSQKAVVRWVMRLDSDLYKVGLYFSDISLS